MTPASAADDMEGGAFEWTWIAKRPPTYCRQHGLRVKGCLNGVWLCAKCILAIGHAGGDGAIADAESKRNVWPALATLGAEGDG